MGPAVGFNRLMLHAGYHYGRLQKLGGGFYDNTPVPANFTGNVPITWSYHGAVATGFSVGLAPF